MRLRPYKPCDGDTVASWLTDEKIHAMWSAGRYAFPMTGQQINERLDAGRDNPCEFMFTALDDDGTPVGYFLLRNADWEAQSVHIGFIVIDSRRRGKGFGKQMLRVPHQSPRHRMLRVVRLCRLRHGGRDLYLQRSGVEGHRDGVCQPR